MLLPARCCCWRDAVASPCARPVASLRASERGRARRPGPDRGARRLRRRGPRHPTRLQSPLETFASEVVAAFEVDELVDYRSRRPMLIFDTDHWDAYAEPSLALHSLRDAERNGLPAARGARARSAVGAVRRRPVDPGRRAGRAADDGPACGAVGRAAHAAARHQRARPSTRPSGRAAGRHRPRPDSGERRPAAAVPAGRGGQRCDRSGGARPALSGARRVSRRRGDPARRRRAHRRSVARARPAAHRPRPPSAPRSTPRCETTRRPRPRSGRSRRATTSWSGRARGPAGETLPTGDQLGAAFERFLAERSRQRRGRRPAAASAVGGPRRRRGPAGTRRTRAS